MATGESAKLRAAFDRFDLNGDGTITHNELRSALDEVGYQLSEQDLSAFIAEADVDRSGTITFEEFAAACQKKPTKEQTTAKLKRLFRSLDVDGSGYITLKDLRTVLNESGAQKMPEDELKKIILSMDRDGDKKVSFDEFAAHMLGQ